MPGTPGASQIRSNRPGASTKSQLVGSDPIRISPPSKLPQQKSSLRYPLNEQMYDHTDYVKFDFYEYKPPFDYNSNTKLVDATGKLVDTKDTAGAIYNNSSAVNNLKRSKRLQGVETIFMYMPEDIGAQYQAEWAGKGFTNPAADILRTSGAFTQGNAGGGFQAVVDSIGRITQKAPSLGATAISAAINALPGNIGGSVSMEEILAGMGGVILNPNVELLFTGFKLRDFGLKFKMAPRDSNEAKEIRDIITTFKKASLPDLSASPDDAFTKLGDFFTSDDQKANEDSNRNYIGVPCLCKVSLMHGTNPHPYLSQFKTCAITSVEVNYTPDGSYAVYGGSEPSPVAYELSLGFSETKLVYQEDISYGGASY
jgi:hypothetical protein